MWWPISGCYNNGECQSGHVCDGNLNECRKHATNYGGDEMDFCGYDGRLCQYMEGDCDNDNDCEGSLECGSDNCGQSTWDSEADCCI